MVNDPIPRQKGVLLHISALPSDYGIGGLGQEAFDFIDYLTKQGFAYWQILPLNYPGYGDSPYNPISSFAGNPFLIDPYHLYELGFVTKQELADARLPNTGKVNFARVYKAKEKLFQAAFHKHNHLFWLKELSDFLDREAYWLRPFAVFSQLKKHHKNKKWQLWNDEFKHYSDQLYDLLLQANPDNILYPVFLQNLFDRQLAELKQYAVQQGIQIIGDLPLYVSLDSSDVWSRQDLFELDENGNPLRVAGVPPDAFSETGQLWGNPLYCWDRMQEEDFDWWKRRLQKSFAFADKLRIDHFIGLVNFWAVDAQEKEAINGVWIKGPGYAFFDSILQVFPRESFIAEDLGILTEEVNNLRENYGFPGMIILQFCFQDGHNDILSFPANKIIYSGTHDNQTTLGWFSLNQKQKKPDNQYLEDYLHRIGILPEEENLTRQNVSRLMTELAHASPCTISIVPMQDILALDDKARMNIPGTALGNWRWRMTDSAFFQTG
ncbi:MAG: 4-alpha-glucanotransferase [Candidatus Cloacimonadaceae bacterium]